MSDTGLIAFFLVVAFAIGVLAGGTAGDASGRSSAREKFLTFCTSQNIPYAKCKEEWEKP